MSWSLFNQNLETGLLAVPPNPEEEIIPELLYEHPATYGNTLAVGEQYRGMFAINPDDSKIMIIPIGYRDVFFSDDDGATWGEVTEYRADPSSGNPCSAIRYHPEEDTWWIGERNIGGANIKFKYSDDDGATWSTVTTSGNEEEYTLTLNVHPDGTLYYHNNALGQVSFCRLTDPKVTHTFTRLATSSVHSNSDKWASGILEGQYFVGLWGTAMIISNALNPASGVTYYPAGTIGNSIKCAFGPDYGLAYGTESGGLVTLLRIFFGVTAPLPTITFDFGFDVQYSNIWYGNERFVLTARDMSDPFTLYVALMNPDTFVWSDVYTITLPRMFNPGGSSDEFLMQLEYYKDGYWLFSYLKDSTFSSYGQYVLIKFFLDDASPFPSAGDTKLFRAIDRQSPDIFFRLDDAPGSDSVLDVGRRRYTNTAHGSLTFEQTGLIGDGGDACLIDSATNTGVLVESVPTPTSHAHVFVLNHDGTASVRILACSGDYSDTDDVGYYVFLAANHKLGVAVYDGGWEYHYSTDALTLNTTYLCAVSLAPNGKVTFYIGNEWDSAIEDVPYDAHAATIMSIGGGWTGGVTLSQSANGVTVDYYALIPLATFNYSLLVIANGGTYTGPPATNSPPLSAGQLKFLVHGDETVFSPTYVNSIQVYQGVNSAPGSSNRIHNAFSADATIAGGKFGGRALYNRGELYGFFTSPWRCSYWNEGHLLEIGTQDFTYDVQVAADWDSGLCYPACNQGAYRRNSVYYRFGGLAIKMTKAEASTANISIYVGCTLEQAIAGSRDSLEIHYTGIPGYIDGDYNHVALCRHGGQWLLFLNGKAAPVPSIVRRNGVSEATIPVLKGGQWLLGGRPDIRLPSEPFHTPRMAVPLSRFDEARLIVGRAEFTEPFEPPTAPYNYG